MTRKYGDIKARESEILELREAGKTRQEIADELGLKKEQIKEWAKRYKKRQAALEKGEIKLPNRKGRPRKSPRTAEEEKEYELRQLRMENELLRNFLQLAGRR